VLLFGMLAGMWWMARHRAHVDRILALQLAGSMGIGTILLAGFGLSVEGAVDVALISALLAAVTTIVFVVSDRRGKATEPGDHP